MGYKKIDNLYNHPNYLQCYALEKIDGSSAHIKYHPDGTLTFFGGCASHAEFIRLFDYDSLRQNFEKLFVEEISWSEIDGVKPVIIIYGEAFGGKIQGMSKWYGPNLRFIAFEVQIGEKWLNVPYAEHIVKTLGLDFVPYEQGPKTIEWLNEQRDRPSLVAIVPDAPREGIVVRDVYENPLSRHIYKHKRPEFRETKSVREVAGDKAKILAEANEVAEEYVTAMRLNHILQKTPYNGPEDTGKVLRAMVEDIALESAGEVEWSKDVEKVISRKTAQLLHNPEIT